MIWGESSLGSKETLASSSTHIKISQLTKEAHSNITGQIKGDAFLPRLIFSDRFKEDILNRGRAKMSRVKKLARKQSASMATLFGLDLLYGYLPKDLTVGYLAKSILIF